MSTVTPVLTDPRETDRDATINEHSKNANENSLGEPLNGDSTVVNKRPRIYYLDRLRTWLTFLVVIHHCFWIVAAGWYPFNRPWVIDIPTLVISYMVLSGNQAYFMGLFFFLSGFVTAPSLKRKGLWIFVKDRFVRLMIPVILYELIFFPLLFCFVHTTWNAPKKGLPHSIGEVWAYYFANYSFTNNHMWFLVTLFALSTIAAVLLTFIRSCGEFVFSNHIKKSVSTRELMFLLLKISSLLVVLNFILRIPFPDGSFWIPVFGNLGFIMQYCVAFTAGILANSYQYLDHIRKQHLPFTIGCAIFFYFLFQLFQIFLLEFLRAVLGFYGHIFLLTLFEQFFAVFWAYSLLVLFKEYQNAEPSKIFSLLIKSAYATYIVHQWVITPLAVGLAYADLHPLLVILILCIIAPILSWGLAILITMIPGSDRIL